MPAPCHQSRSSIDLGVSKPQTPAPRRTKPSPPRLQHSPSLPNIWHVLFKPNLTPPVDSTFYRFPPHSRPLPAHMSYATRDTTQNPDLSSAPSSQPSQPPSNTPRNIQSKIRRDDMSSALEKLSLKGRGPRRSNIKATPSYTRKRQWKDRDPSQHLLTPPLTPSSSIRTTASADSADGKPDDKAQVLQDLQEPSATRFLYVSR
jgi:hypothetical protein